MFQVRNQNQATTHPNVDFLVFRLRHVCDWLGGPHLWSGHASNNENKNAFSIDFGITDSGFKNRVAANPTDNH